MRFDLIEARETEVLELLALRLTNREVVDALVISPFTVRRYLDNTSQKLGVRGRRAVVEHAHRPAIPLKWLLSDHVSLRPWWYSTIGWFPLRLTMAWPLPDMIGKLRDFSREAGRIEPAALLDLQTDQSSHFQGEKTMTATAAKPQGRPWWLTLIMGIAAVAIGGILIFGSLTAQTRLYLLLIQLVGIWWLIDGITTIIYMFVDRSAWGWKLAAGIVGMLAGGWILIYPVYAAVALPRIFLLIIGIWGVVYGGQLLFASLRTRAWASVALGAITVVLGLILIANADEAGWGLSLITMAAWFAFLGGFVVIYRALRERKV